MWQEIEDKIGVDPIRKIPSSIIDHRRQVALDRHGLDPDEIGAMLPDPGNLPFTTAILLKNYNLLHCASTAVINIPVHSLLCQMSNRIHRVQKR